MPTPLADPLEAKVHTVLNNWDLGGDPFAVEKISQGHINQTYFVSSPRSRWVLQRLSSIFAPEVNVDIDAITARLAAAGLTTPRLVRTRNSHLWHLDADGHCWRLQTFVAGETVERVDSADRARQAGRLLGRFHDALKDDGYAFQQQRLGVHDTVKHLAALKVALVTHGDHRLIAQVRPLADALIERTSALVLPPGLPQRIVHGDPKITNIIFSPDGKAVALVDLDTVARMALPLELGDALRSWCNRAAEDQPGVFDIDFFEAALQGYLEVAGTWIDGDEKQALGSSVDLIACELATRFCADALNESYFGWDSARYCSAGDHNLARAQGQFGLAQSIAPHRKRIAEAVRST